MIQKNKIKKVERIKASAVKIHENQKIYTGKRHSDCLKLAADAGEKLPINGVQGFITNKGKFVSRHEAAKIAFSSGQTLKDEGFLYSEDLW